MRVTLDIYSGRENPSWDLSANETRELIARVAGKTLPSVEDVEGTLGFRGYIVAVSEDTDDTARDAGLPDVFRIGGDLPQQFTHSEMAEETPAIGAEDAK